MYVHKEVTTETKTSQLRDICQLEREVESREMAADGACSPLRLYDRLILVQGNKASESGNFTWTQGRG